MVKKIILLLSFFSFQLQDIFSQAGMWTWMHGDSIANPIANYGTQGVASPLNKPPGLYETCEWTDLNGNFWMFGGCSDSPLNSYGDLWKYNPSTNEWTWVKGNALANDSGSYGTLGVPSVNNQPPARGWGAAAWTDLNNNLWLYGGGTRNSPNTVCGRGDMWKYDISANIWTWMHGSALCSVSPYYVTVGIPSPLNTPGTRLELSSTWVDSTNNLWLFGGLGTSDLWKYDITINEWALIKGDTIPYQPGVYGIKGVPDPLNIPGGRYAYSTWKDVNEKFWLFGGHNIYSGTYLNDMWMYDPSTNNWAWMSGTDLTNQPASSGNYCEAATGFYPASRFENRARWIDACGKFWMYGGSHCNDLWYFDPVTLEWALVNGHPTNQFFHAAVYGTIGTPSSTNQPGSRFGSVGWIGNDGVLYHFGGLQILGLKNDLWKFVPDTTCGGCNISTSVVENNTVAQFQIFPNPSSTGFQILNFKFNPGDEVILSDVLGKIIFTKQILSFTTILQVKISGITNGIYFLHIKTKKDLFTKKLVIQE